MSPTKLSPSGYDFIARWEGLELKAYRDSAGLWTIGIGHLLTRSELSSGKIYIGGLMVKWRNGISEQEAYTLFEQDASKTIQAIRSGVTALINQNHFDALVSWTFNVGVGAFSNSTLLRLLNQKQYGMAAKQFERWIWSGGRIVQGLINRRKAERELFERPV